MNFTRAELGRLAAPLVAALVLLGAGAGLIWWTNGQALLAKQQVAAARAERQQNAERLMRIAEEEKEVKEKLQVYQRLKALNIIGEERRLEWADAVARIRAQRELLDLSYRVEPQKLQASHPGKPGPVDFYASQMTVELALLHEEDLLRFLSDLRQSGNAYYSVRECRLARSGALPTGVTITPRLRGECKIDLITLQDAGAKK